MKRPTSPIAPFEIRLSGYCASSLLFAEALPPIPAEHLAGTALADRTPSRTWTVEEQSQFIESLLLGLPVPPVLAESMGGRQHLLRGHQRVEAVRAFMQGHTRLSGLQVLTDMNGKTWADLEGTYDGDRLACAEVPVLFCRGELTPAQRAHLLRHFQN